MKVTIDPEQAERQAEAKALALNRRIAEWCGWQAVDKRSVSPYKWLSPRMTVHEESPPYGTSRDACAEFEGLLEDRGLWLLYVPALDQMIDRTPKLDQMIWKDRSIGEFRVARQDWFSFMLLRATPAQRCAAMVRVLDGEVEV